MIRLRLATLALALVAFTGVGQAQEALKIGTVDIGKVFNGYWKTQLSRSQSAERRADFQKIEQGMIDEIKQIEQELIRLAESVRDPANSKAKQEADAKKYQEKQGDHRRSMTQHAEYKRNADRTMREMGDRLTRARMDEIKEVVAAKAKEAGYDLVLNLGDRITANVIYTVGKNDLSDVVLIELNKDMPEEYKAKQPPAAEGTSIPAAPAPAQAPAEK